MCRSRELPDLYSHYGSRGIVVQAVLPVGPSATSAMAAARSKVEKLLRLYYVDKSARTASQPRRHG